MLPVCLIAAERPITFQVGEASLTIPFSETYAHDLDTAIDALLQTFRYGKRDNHDRSTIQWRKSTML